MRRRYRTGRARTTSITGVIITLVLVAAGYYFSGQRNANQPPAGGAAPPNASERSGITKDQGQALRPANSGSPSREVRVDRVVDGDTLRLPDNERVRLIGIDTPESVKPDSPVEPFGPEASRFTKNQVEGKTVTLRFDREAQDQYGRTLAYVYFDGVLLNELIIRQGFSRAQLQYDYSDNMKDLFREAEEEARREKRGVWSLR